MGRAQGRSVGEGPACDKVIRGCALMGRKGLAVLNPETIQPMRPNAEHLMRLVRGSDEQHAKAVHRYEAQALA